MFAIQLLRWLLWMIEAVLALPILYLCLVSVSALLRVRRRKKDALAFPQPSARFALLIPAHNEAGILGGLLESLVALHYPQEKYDVYIVADNCDDTTAELARVHGLAQVYERFDQTMRGKGFALRWLLDRLASEQRIYDAYVILDADSVVDPAFLQAMNAGLAQGAQALQAHNTVLNTLDSSSTVLRWLALTLMNHVRPLGRNGLGGSSTLTGNGMCLTDALLKLYPWRAFALSEDYQYYLTLAQNGEGVVYMPEAIVRSEMPRTFAQMRTQDIRWEGGQDGNSTWGMVWKLLVAGVRKRSFICLEAIAELLVPSLSSLVGCCLLVLLVSLLLWSLPGLLISLLLIAGMMCYIGSAIWFLRAPRAVLQALLSAPGFILWKLWVLLVVKRRKNHVSAWVRTSRNG
ncbi:MAG TPA: glycosyltransferase family 2 protein [Ktedonobacteraceae bacterium]|nr:glycosyltransferase family 2 protein [Ktedonobacteraceae bacterium]